MKFLAFAFMLAAVNASAKPYFRVIDPAHPQPVVGALVDTIRPGQSQAASLLPIFTHSPADGCLLPSIVCEDWTPLAVGASMNAGKVTFDVAPLANLMPWMRTAGQALIPAGWTTARSLVDYTPTASDPLTISAGPVWEYSQLQNRGSFKIFSGLALHF